MLLKEFIEKIKEKLEGKGIKVETILELINVTKDEGFSIVVNNEEKPTYIPKDRFNEVIAQKNAYKEQIESLNVEIEKLKKTTKNNEEIQGKIEEMQQEIEKNKQKVNETLIKAAVKVEANKAGAYDEDDVLRFVDLDKITVKNDEVIGIDKEIEEIKNNKPYLFKSEEKEEEKERKGTGGSKGNRKKDKEDILKNPWSKKYFNLTEQGKIIRQDVDLARKLKLQAELEEKE